MALRRGRFAGWMLTGDFRRPGAKTDLKGRHLGLASQKDWVRRVVGLIKRAWRGV